MLLHLEYRRYLHHLHHLHRCCYSKTLNNNLEEQTNGTVRHNNFVCPRNHRQRKVFASCCPYHCVPLYMSPWPSLKSYLTQEPSGIYIFWISTSKSWKNIATSMTTFKPLVLIYRKYYRSFGWGTDTTARRKHCKKKKLVPPIPR